LETEFFIEFHLIEQAAVKKTKGKNRDELKESKFVINKTRDKVKMK